MLFNTFAFILFAAVFFAGWPLARRHRQFRFVYIVAFSLFFYGWMNPWNIGILLVCVSVDFFAGLLIEDRPKQKKLWLAASIGTNLAILGGFKYAHFIASSLGPLVPPELLEQIPKGTDLPLGISFFTFQSMTYAIDIYRGTFRPTRNYLHYLSFTTLFPHLIAGPIVRAADLLPQLNETPRTTWADRQEGLWRIMVGYFRKVVIADNLAPGVAAMFATKTGSTAYWWLAAALFAVQVYCDFSGYSEIARGLAKWMGYDFWENFRRPFMSKSVQELWQRWHMSLSSWFRDYVYFPLGGSRKGELRTSLNLIVVMLVSGLWHGAAWTFVIWGLWNGVMLALERKLRWHEALLRIPRVGVWTANLVLLMIFGIGVAIFRSETFDQMQFVLRQMLIPNTSWQDVLSVDRSAVLIFLGCVIWHIGSLALEHREVSEAAQLWGRRLAFIGMGFALVLMRGPGHSFVYFQF